MNIKIKLNDVCEKTYKISNEKLKKVYYNKNTITIPKLCKLYLQNKSMIETIIKLKRYELEE